MKILAAINHGVCTPARCRSCGELVSQLWEIGAAPFVVTDSPSAAIGARRTLEAAIHLSHGSWDRVLYIEDDAILAPDAAERLSELAHEPDLPPVIRLFAAMPAPRTIAAAPRQYLDRNPGPFSGAVACLLSWPAVAAACKGPAAQGHLPVERMMLDASRDVSRDGDGRPQHAILWPSVVQHRGELASVHRPEQGGRGTYSPSFRERYG